MSRIRAGSNAIKGFEILPIPKVLIDGFLTRSVQNHVPSIGTVEILPPLNLEISTAEIFRTPAYIFVAARHCFSISFLGFPNPLRLQLLTAGTPIAFVTVCVFELKV